MINDDSLHELKKVMKFIYSVTIISASYLMLSYKA